MKEEKKFKVTEEEFLKLKRSNEKKKAVIVILIFTMVIILMLAILFYLVLDNNQPDADVKKDDCNCGAVTNCTSIVPSLSNEKVSSVKEINLTNKNQTVKIGNKEYKVKIGTGNDHGMLQIDDNYVNTENSTEHIYVDHAYLTEKYMFFTISGQFAEWIAYVIGEEGVVAVNNNEAQMQDFKIVNGELHATGGVPHSDGYEMVIDNNDLLIKFTDNTLIVTGVN